MATSTHGTFQEALDVVESLSDDQQEELIDIVRRRKIERRRAEIAENIRVGREEHARGETRSGTIQDLMKELDE